MSLFGTRISGFFGGTTSGGGGGGGVSGTGSTNVVAKWLTSTSIGNSSIFDNGTNVGIGTLTPDVAYKLTVFGDTKLGSSTSSQVYMTNGLFFDLIGSIYNYPRIYSASPINFQSANTTAVGGNIDRLIFGTIGGNVASTFNEVVANAGDLSATSGTANIFNVRSRMTYGSATTQSLTHVRINPSNQSSVATTNTIRGVYYSFTDTSGNFGGSNIAWENTNGDIIHGNLSGASTQMVTADTNGKLSVTALPVPYTGATGNVNLGEYGITTGYAQFDTTPTTYTPAVGNLGWSTTENTLEFQLTGGNVTLQIGQEQVVYVKNVDSAPIVDGEAVYIFGASGDRPSVKKASNSSALTSARTIGIATEPIAVNGFGFITVQGIVHGLNTNAFNNGDQLWVGSTAGTIVNTKPASPLYSVFIGVCVKKSGGDGHIYVYPQVGFNLDELNDVNAPSPSNNDGIFWNSTSLVWENKSIATALGYTPANSSTIANGSTNGLLSSTDWTTMMNGWELVAYQLMGSVIKSQSLSVTSIMELQTSTSLSDAALRFFAIYLPIGATITGVKWFQATQGVYTADAYNGVGLYTYSAGTLTLVASSTNDGNIWKGTTNTWQSKAFTSTYSAAAGLYFIACLYNQSAQTTAPSIGSANNSANSSVATVDFTNSAKISGSISAQASLPTPQASSGITTSNVNIGFWLY